MAHPRDRQITETEPRLPPTPTFPPGQTALLLVDALNEFLKPGGKLYERTRETAEAANTVANLKRVTAAARKAGISDRLREPSQQSRRRIRRLEASRAGAFGDPAVGLVCTRQLRRSGDR